MCGYRLIALPTPIDTNPLLYCKLYMVYYNMASSASGQDEPNCAMWLATRAGKMESSCPAGTTRWIPQEKFPRRPNKKSFIDQVCSVEMAGYWPRSFFCEFMGLDFVSIHKHAKKELGQYPAILTSHLINNSYLYSDTLVNFDWVLTNQPFTIFMSVFQTFRAISVARCYTSSIVLNLI